MKIVKPLRNSELVRLCGAMNWSAEALAGCFENVQELVRHECR
jgi:hypothetical protein